MTEADEITKQVDMVYKNLLEKFNPASRSLITAGKAYLKALHGAMSASKIYLDALTKVARQSQQGCWGGSSDIGMCLMQMVDVYKEVQSQQMNILKAFYVDLLVPLETNLDKDTKVLQSEQKKFLGTHKQKLETYTKAVSQLKKHKKRNRANKGGMDREIKQYQTMEEERLKLDSYLETSLQNAVTQERRRYGFILERQCSLARHYQAYHSKGASFLAHSLDHWQGVSATRESLPNSILAMLPSARPREEGIYSTPQCDDDAVSLASQVRRARSMDGSCNDLSTIMDEVPSRPVTRARSEFNLDQHRFTPDPSMLRRSMAIPDDGGRRAMARALYPYQTSGDNQLAFLENDFIGLIGEKSKGWQYGENLRTQRCGWFPVAYTELFNEEDDSALGTLARRLPSSRSSISEHATSADSTDLGSDSSSSILRPVPTVTFHKPPSTYHNHLPPGSATHSLHHPTKHRSSSNGTIQVGAQCATSASDACATAASQTLQRTHQPLPHRPHLAPNSSKNSSIQNSPSSHHNVVPLHTQPCSLQNSSSSSLQTIQTASSDSTTSCSVDTVLFNQHNNHHGSSPPREISPKGQNLRSNSNVSSSILSSLANASSLLSSHLQKRGSGNSTFHMSDDSGFSNESGNDSTQPSSNPQHSHSDINEPHTQNRNALSSRWVSSNSTFTVESEQISLSTDCSSFLACPASQLQNHNSYSSNSTPDEFSATLPSRGKSPRHRDLSLPSLSVEHFVTIARRKVNSVRSPCASKIAAQKGKRTLKRSSSLLCLNVDSCTGRQDDGYDDVFCGDWRHESLVDVAAPLPDPPPFQPPPVPSHQSTPSSRPPMPLPHDSQITPASSENSMQTCSSTTADHSSKEFIPQNSSSGNSTLTGSEENEDSEDGEEEEDEEVYMVVSDHRRELRQGRRRQVCRSLTWASPRPASSPPALRRKGGKLERSPARSFRRTEDEKRKSRMHVHQEQNWILRKPKSDDSPPVPPRRKSSRPHFPLPTVELSSRQGTLTKHIQDLPSRQQQDLPNKNHKGSLSKRYQNSLSRQNRDTQSIHHQDSFNRQKHQQSTNIYRNDFNIFNYGDYLHRRLRCPEGAAQLDQRSMTTGNLCGPWYDLWGDDGSVADV